MRSRLAVLAALLVAGLAGCASIPQSGPVQAAGDTDSQSGSIELDILASGPQKGATQEEIVRGFIDAAASPQAGYETARLFLTPRFEGDWNPDAGAIVDRGGDREFASTGELAMTATVRPVADVTAHGQYTEAASTAPVELAYEFEQVDGEWRISKAPDGIVIDQPAFLLTFDSYTLYFFDPTFTWLVPDLRWFARRASTPTVIVRELLAGASPWLAPAVVSAFPEGTTLTSSSVQVVASEALVDLSTDALNADQTTLARMMQQLKISLLSVPAIGSVAISTNQIVQDIPASSDPAVLPPTVDSRALVLRDGGFGYLGASGDSLETIPGLSDAIAGLAPTAVTLGLHESTAAVLNAQGAWSLTAGDPPTPVDQRPGLIAPAIDDLGVVWTVPQGDPTALQVTAPDGTVGTVETHWPDGVSRIVSLRVSRDGTRVIALVEAGGLPRLVAASVVRDENHRMPVALGDTVIELATADGTARDAGWIDALSVVSLVESPDGGSVLLTQQLGGPSSVLEGTAGSAGVTAGNTVRDLRLVTGDGTLFQRRGIGWQKRIDGVVLVATQQGL